MNNEALQLIIALATEYGELKERDRAREEAKANILELGKRVEERKQEAIKRVTDGLKYDLEEACKVQELPPQTREEYINWLETIIDALESK